MQWNGKLTQGAVERIHNQQQTGLAPVLQILDVKAVQKKSGSGGIPQQTRYRLVVSDGELFMYGMLASQHNHLVESQELAINSIVRVDQYICTPLAERILIAMIDISVLSGPVNPIGAPEKVSCKNSSSDSSSSSSWPQKNVSSTSTTLQHPVGSAIVRPQTSTEDGVLPIAMLNPYNNRWKIKARVTNKGQMRHWSNAKGAGKLFSVDLLDDEDGEIRCTMFNEAADKFDAIFEVNKVFYVSGGSIKLANKKFSGHLKTDYEITLNADADVRPAADSGGIKKMSFNFVPISSLSERAKDSFVDILAVVSAVGPLSVIQSQRMNKELKKRVLSLVDASQSSIDLTLWGEDAEKYSEVEVGNQNILAGKNCRVSDFGGVSLGTTSASVIELDPDLSPAHQLRAWWDREGSSTRINSLSSASGGSLKSSSTSRQTFRGAKDAQLGFQDTPDYFDVKATITSLKFDPENRLPWYDACPSANCNKKVLQDSSGQWLCEKCDQSYPNSQARYILSFQAADGTDAEWLSAFNEIAEQILGGTSADQLKQWLEMGDQTSVERVFESAQLSSYVFRVRAKAEDRMGTLKVRHTVMSCAAVDLLAESRLLLDAIRQYGI